MTQAEALSGYVVKSDIAALDLDRVHEWLSKDAYWSLGIPRDLVEKAFSNSVVFGLFHEEDGQVGVARMVTDKATYGYLADVYIRPDHRGKGLGKVLLQAVEDHEDLQGLRRVMLTTSDMHPLYRHFDYDAPENPDIVMEKVVKDIYLR